MGRKKKNKILEKVAFTGIADRGKAVGRDAEGKVVFVDRGAVPGDVADVVVTRKRKGFFQGRVVRYHTYSDDRVEPFCDYFGVCGGCKWQHTDYEAQLRHKEQVVRDALTRIAKADIEEFRPIMGSSQTTYYRNKMEFSFSNKRWLKAEELNDPDIAMEKEVLGFHPPGAFDKVVDIHHCWLQPDPSNAIRNASRVLAKELGLPFYDARTHEGFMRNMMLRITDVGEVLLLVAFARDEPEKYKPFLDGLIAKNLGLSSVYYCINTKVNDFLLDLPLQLYYGKPYVEDALGDVRFRIGPKSFFQTNTRQARQLYDVVVDFAGLTGSENVYDLYTGIGSIGLYMARRAGQIVGIEEIPAAIEDAKVNAQINGIENAVFYAGDVKNILTSNFAMQHGRPDVLITAPPRAGMHPDVVQMLLMLEAPRIVYVSCNPATQARDLQVLLEKYKVRRVQPVDMFPHTHHIENIALLELK
ncbi:MAG: 23S rRNA (uracil(1939)-C(5))-methyltransferase RlmD [Saprospiraceae bacterium]|nr:23S rRNA (uracil(1939)-C(5))-methyltransferase RlmD [Saprospiraceae bacterium]